MKTSYTDWLIRKIGLPNLYDVLVIEKYQKEIRSKVSSKINNIDKAVFPDYFLVEVW